MTTNPRLIRARQQEIAESPSLANPEDSSRDALAGYLKANRKSLKLRLVDKFRTELDVLDPGEGYTTGEFEQHTIFSELPKEEAPWIFRDKPSRILMTVVPLKY